MLKNKKLDKFLVDEYLRKSKETYELCKNIDMLALVEGLKLRLFEKEQEVYHLRCELISTKAELDRCRKENKK